MLSLPWSTKRIALVHMSINLTGWLGGKLVYEHGVAIDPVPGEADRGRTTRFGYFVFSIAIAGNTGGVLLPDPFS
jgi:hypothetical protein